MMTSSSSQPRARTSSRVVGRKLAWAGPPRPAFGGACFRICTRDMEGAYREGVPGAFTFRIHPARPGVAGSADARDVGGLEALGSLDQLELDGLAFGEAAEP